MRKKKIIAMLLAGGQGSRLGLLTKNVAKPAVPFGGKYRIIDFPLSNCANSGIDVVGVLTQYQPLELNSYIGSGQPWDLDLTNGGVFVLPPYMKAKSGDWYRGTANAIYQNIPFIEQYDPDYVLILSGDHIYKMNYNAMLNAHIDAGADATIAVRPVPWKEAPSFGIMNADADGRILEFEEKPKKPKSTNASMGIYVFRWPVLRKFLIEDEEDPKSDNDFGKNVIPAMLNAGLKLFAYNFDSYWKDVGTIKSLWEANMDLLGENPEFDLVGKDKIYSRSPAMPAARLAASSVTANCLICEGSEIDGTVRDSVISYGCIIAEGAEVENSVLMPDVVVGPGAVVKNAIVGEGTVIGEGAQIGAAQVLKDESDRKITVIGKDHEIEAGALVKPGEVI